MSQNRQSIIFSVIIAIVVAILVIFSQSIVTVNSGTVGVVKTFGKVERVIYPGLNIKVPFVQTVVTYNTQRIIYETSDYPTESMADYTDYSVDTTTKDGQPVKIKYSVRFSVNPDNVEWIANNLGDEIDIVEKIVKTDSRIYVRGFVREYEANELYTGNVTAVQDVISQALSENFSENGLILDEFGIRSIDFSTEYVSAIEQKQIEKEKVTTEKYIADQEEFKKQASITRAEAEAEAQRLLQVTITNQILQKMWIEKWDGDLPNVVLDSDQSMILDASDLD